MSNYYDIFIFLFKVKRIDRSLKQLWTNQIFCERQLMKLQGVKLNEIVTIFLNK